MQENINLTAEAVGQDYWVFTEGMKGAIASFFTAQDPSAAVNRYRLEAFIQRSADYKFAQIGKLIQGQSDRTFQEAVERAQIGLKLRGITLTTDKADALRALSESATSNLVSDIGAQIQRDSRAAMQFVLAKSIRVSQIVQSRGRGARDASMSDSFARGITPTFEAVDRAGRRWSSAKMIRTLVRHHLVLTDADTFIGMIEQAGVVDLKLVSESGEQPFSLADYDQIRAERLHPNSTAGVTI